MSARAGSRRCAGPSGTGRRPAGSLSGGGRRRRDGRGWLRRCPARRTIHWRRDDAGTKGCTRGFRSGSAGGRLRAFGRRAAPARSPARTSRPRRGRALRARRRGHRHHHRRRPQPDEGAASEPNDPMVGSAVSPHGSHGTSPPRRTGRLTIYNKLRLAICQLVISPRTAPSPRRPGRPWPQEHPPTGQRDQGGVQDDRVLRLPGRPCRHSDCRQQHRGRARRSRLLRRRQGVAVRHAADCGYMVSRGLAKAGSRDPYWSERGDPDTDR